MGSESDTTECLSTHTHVYACAHVCVYIHIHTCFNRGALGEVLVLPPAPYKEPVVVRIISLLSSKDAHIPTPEPVTQVTFPGETDSTDGITRMNLEMGRLSWVIQVD